MTSKTAAETVYNLNGIFCTMSPPAILQSDNGREFVSAVIRQDATEGQHNSRAEMLKTTTAKLAPLALDDPVLNPVNEFDRGRLDCRNVPGVVLENDMYRVGTTHGIINKRFSRNQLMKADFQIVSTDMVNETQLLPFRTIAALHSKHGGQGYKCSCQGQCKTKRCNCFKNKTMCHSHCHPLSTACKNK